MNESKICNSETEGEKYYRGTTVDFPQQQIKITDTFASHVT